MLNVQRSQKFVNFLLCDFRNCCTIKSSQIFVAQIFVEIFFVEGNIGGVDKSNTIQIIPDCSERSLVSQTIHRQIWNSNGMKVIRYE